jgi:hypothetical protein
MGENPSPLGEDLSLIKYETKGSRGPGFKDSSKKDLGTSFLVVSTDGKAKKKGSVT